MGARSFARRRPIVAAVALSAVAVGGAVGTGTLAWGAIGGSGVINGCVGSNGALRAIDTGASCADGETAIAWNQQGPSGPTGATGPAGLPPVLAGTTSAYGQPATLSCTGEQQGVIAGPNADKSTNVADATYSVTTPRDPQSGFATGKRQYKPITVVKQLDVTSPRYFRAIAYNESLTTCTIRFYRASLRSVTGPVTPKLYYTVKLTNASVASDEVTKGDSRLPTEGGLAEYETLTFTFHKIELTDVATGTTVADDWQAPVS